MDRSRVENAIMELYRRRLTNETEPCLECFADNVAFRLAGGQRSGGFSAAIHGRSALRPIFNGLTETWKWTRHEPQSVIVDGNKAAVRAELTATHAPTGSMVVTEVMDEFVFDEDLKIVSFVEFVDTAAIEKLGN